MKTDWRLHWHELEPRVRVQNGDFVDIIIPLASVEQWEPVHKLVRHRAFNINYYDPKSDSNGSEYPRNLANVYSDPESYLFCSIQFHSITIHLNYLGCPEIEAYIAAKELESPKEFAIFLSFARLLRRIACSSEYRIVADRLIIVNDVVLT